MTRIESIIALLKANTGASTVAPTSVATYANLAETITLETISSGIMATSPLNGAFAGLPTADLLDQMFISLFDYTQAEMDALKATEAGAAGYQYWIDELNNNSDLININTLAIALLNGASAEDSAKASALVANDVAAYEIFAGETETPVETDGQTVYLTAGQDILVGTDGNDTFIARGNNTLTNADIIDGGKGTDTVYVMLDSEETAESPLLTNVEILKVQVQDNLTVDTNDNGNNNTGDNDVDAGEDVESNIDAGDMKSVHTYINDNSRADLAIEDVSRNSHITTLVMRETDMGDVDYNVYFDPENITAPGTADQGATLLIKLANVLNIAETENPVENFASLSFNVGATTVNVDISDATSYDDVVTAIEAAISAANIVGLTVEKQASAPAYFSIDVEGYQAGQLAGNYNPILITNNASGVLTPGTIELSESATNANMTNTMTNVEGSTVPSLTQTNVVFDRVGRDSKGGDFLAGSDSTGASGSKGIEQFNVSVDRDSWLKSVSSTNNTLEVINIKNIEENSDGNGSLRIDSVSDVRVIDASAMTGSANITAALNSVVTTKYLDLKDTQADNAADNSDDSFLNVVDTYFSYDFGSNNDKFDLTISGSNLENAGTTSREDFVLEINGNDGNDTITVDITTMTVNGYANSKENANLTINGGAGNDTITTENAGDWIINAGTGNDTVYSDNTGDKSVWSINADSTGYNAPVEAVYTINLTNAATDTQGGALVIAGQVVATFVGAATASDMATAIDGNTITINDVVYDIDATNPAAVTLTAQTAENNTQSIDVEVYGNTGGVVVQPTTTSTNPSTDGEAEVIATDVDDLDSLGAGNYAMLYKSELTVTYAPKNGVTTAAASALANGYESTVTIPTINYIGNQASVNQAIKAAINNDAVLSKLLVAKDGPANTLVITSLIDGANVLEDLEITVEAATLADLTTSEQSALQTAYEKLVSDSDATLTQAILNTAATTAETAATPSILEIGSNSDNLGSDNTIDLGNGNDVVVLSTDSDSNETIVFTGTIGENTIVGFNTGNTAAGGDYLDFTSYLTNTKSASGSTESEQHINITVVNGAVAGTTLSATQTNTIIVMNDVDFSDTETFEGLTADLLKAAIIGTNTGTNDYANIDDDSLDFTTISDVNAATINDLVQTTQKHILMIENELNDGEYKVFELSVTDSTAEIATVTLLGTVDFGEEVTAATLVDNIIA